LLYWTHITVEVLIDRRSKLLPTIQTWIFWEQTNLLARLVVFSFFVTWVAKTKPNHFVSFFQSLDEKVWFFLSFFLMKSGDCVRRNLSRDSTVNSSSSTTLPRLHVSSVRYCSRMVEDPPVTAESWVRSPRTKFPDFFTFLGGETPT